MTKKQRIATVTLVAIAIFVLSGVALCSIY
jgi:hypothetical protein